MERYEEGRARWEEAQEERSTWFKPHKRPRATLFAPGLTRRPPDVGRRSTTKIRSRSH